MTLRIEDTHPITYSKSRHRAKAAPVHVRAYDKMTPILDFISEWKVIVTFFLFGCAFLLAFYLYLVSMGHGSPGFSQDNTPPAFPCPSPSSASVEILDATNLVTGRSSVTLSSSCAS